jgi:selenocysteine lyase/cysteine desulfurase
VRKNFPVLQDVTYLNVGTYGIMPEPALTAFQEVQANFERRGVASNRKFGRMANEAREQVAALIHAEKDEIAFTRNATDGINLVLAGMEWLPGDEVITTDEEHEAMFHPLMYLHKQKGLKLIRLAVSPQPEIMLDRLSQAVTSKTKLVAMSLVSCETGTRLPAREISAWAADRELWSLFDGAQASGAFPVDVAEIGCDFYSSNGHKWLSGPKGTGFFCARLPKLLQLSPAHVGAGSLAEIDFEKDTAEPFTTGQRFEFGTRSWPVYAGLKASLDWFETLGWENVYRHIGNLSNYLKDQIRERKTLKLISPYPFDESSGLVSFIINDHQAGDVSSVLRQDDKIYTRVIPHYNALRISTAHFNNTEDIDRLMEALDRITA